MARHSYVYEDGLVTLDWLFNSGFIRVVRRYWNKYSRQKETWMYHEFNISKKGYVSWQYGYHLQPDQIDKALELAKKNHVNIMGF